MLTLKDKAFDIIPIPFTKDLTSDEKQYLEELIQSINQQLKATTNWLNTDTAKEYFKKVQEMKNEFFNDELLQQELDNIISHSTDNVEEFINNFYETGAKIGYNDIKRRVSYTPADENALYHLTKYNFELVRNLNNELSYGIRHTIFEGAMSGKNPLELVPTIENLPLEPLKIPLKNGKYRTISTKTRAEMIARTEYARAQCNGKLQAYANYGVEKVDVLTCGDDLVCDKCKYYENNGPYTLKEAQGILPLHPNCRCTYKAHILNDNEEGQDIDQYYNNIPTSPIKSPDTIHVETPLVYDEKFDKVKTISDIENYFGVKAIKTPKGGIIFKDEKNKFRIKFNNDVINGRKAFIDINNNGKYNHNMKDVLKAYYDASPVLKNEIHTIVVRQGIFENRAGGYNKGRINLYHPAFLYDKYNAQDNFQRTLYHEMGHAFLIKINNAKKLKNPGYADNKDEKYKKEVKKDIENVKNLTKEYDKFVSKYARNYYDKYESYVEDFAETVSMVECFRVNKSNAIIMLDNGKLVNYNMWSKRYPNRIKLIKNLLNEYA